ncbi:mannitol dehydrogenase family protein [uncultured Roseobacter sp.]|uniref:mannitol dehydrogenase family protein n=1 Tax=uncultured Roseobacter sp. TaxID=114847 RepID=UPI0026266AED|nr:mannitol dehydrogenase family protein [uncultured Roseobacter sp.]
MIKLNENALTSLGPTVAVPRYDRSLLKPGILHIGVGNFHRAHQAFYLDALHNTGADPSWGICGAGVRAPDARMRADLAEQDWLYTVVEVESEDLQAQIVGSMIDFVEVEPTANLPLLSQMADPVTRIVSLTVTEGGYFVDSATGEFDLTHPLVAADIATPGSANTVFGALVTALAARKSASDAPFTVMSCDNLPGNGDAARAAVMGMAGAMDGDLAAWISDHVSFPNAMVDRITPATGDRERASLAENFGITDNFPVFCEPFRQWVLEDDFVNGRPELEAVGVTFTKDIHDFEKMKIRILNGGHAILAYPAALMGVEFAHDALRNTIIRAFLRKVLTEDVLHLVADVPGFTAHEYLDLICKRVENTGVADQISRLCLDGSNRQPKFTIPSIRDDLAQGHMPIGLALSAALWCRYCAGRTDAGQEIPPNDPSWDNLHSVAVAAQTDPHLWLQQSEIYGDVGANADFAELFASCLKSLQTNGTEDTLRMYLNGDTFSAVATLPSRLSS